MTGILSHGVAISVPTSFAPSLLLGMGSPADPQISPAAVSGEVCKLCDASPMPSPRHLAQNYL